MAYLINTIETYRVDNEAEVQTILENAKSDKKYELTKYNCSQKDIKVKGEVVDNYYKVTLTKQFTSEKEPERQVEISYDGGGTYNGAF